MELQSLYPENTYLCIFPLLYIFTRHLSCVVNDPKWTYTYNEGPHMDSPNIEEGDSANPKGTNHANKF